MGTGTDQPHRPRLRRIDKCAVIMKGRAPGHGQAGEGHPGRQRWPSAPRRTAGAMPSDVPTMQPTMIFRPRSMALSRMMRPSVKPPVLSSLDIDGIIAPGKLFQPFGRMGTFIRTDDDRPFDAAEDFVLACRQRLLNQDDAGLPAAAFMFSPRYWRRSNLHWHR